MELQTIQTRIHEIRGLKVMLDFDLAALYEVETKVLNQAVKRNLERFPEKFMFRHTGKEWATMRSQLVTASSQVKRNERVMPFAFTEHGVTMLASVLKSGKAIRVNISIVEAFIALRQFALNYKDLACKIKELEGKYDDVYEAINYLLEKDKEVIVYTERKRIGYKK